MLESAVGAPHRFTTILPQPSSVARSSFFYTGHVRGRSARWPVDIMATHVPCALCLGLLTRPGGLLGPKSDYHYCTYIQPVPVPPPAKPFPSVTALHCQRGFPALRISSPAPLIPPKPQLRGLAQPTRSVKRNRGKEVKVPTTVMPSASSPSSSPSLASHTPSQTRLSQISSHIVPMAATAFDANVVPQAPEDPLFGLMAAFRRDEHPDKVDLGIGAYRDDNAKPWILPVVKMVR